MALAIGLRANHHRPVPMVRGAGILGWNMLFPWGLPYLAFVMFVTIVGFWPSYFGQIGRAPLPFHVHAISALIWLNLLAVQTWSIQQRRSALHKQVGQASFVLFPLLIMGLVAIVNLTATRYASGDHSQMAIEPAVGIITFAAIFGYLTLFYLAIRHRRNARLHGGYLLATPLILFESPASRATGRLFNWPNFANRTEFQQFGDSITVLNVVAIVFALMVYASNRKHGAPWLTAVFFLALQSLLVYFPEAIPGFTAFFIAYGQLPAAVTLGGGLIAGALVSWLGWEHGKPPPRRAPTPQPAE